MTRDNITTQVMNRLNLTSSTATTRVNLEIQERYNWVLGELGNEWSSRGSTTANTASGTRTITFTMLRLDQLYFTTSLVPLDRVPLDELRRLPTASSSSSTKYAVVSDTGTTVTVMLENTPNSIVGMTADGLIAQADLGASTVPSFPAIFHDIIVYGVLGIELRKMEKLELASSHELLMRERMKALKVYLDGQVAT